MSRFGMLQRQFNLSKKHISDRSKYLILHAEELADDFGQWLSQAESGQSDPFCEPIPVKAVARYLDDNGELAFSDNLSRGEVEDYLNFALEFSLPGEDSPRLSGTIRIPLSIRRTDEGVDVSVVDGDGSFGYRRRSVPELLFDELFDLCGKALTV